MSRVIVVTSGKGGVGKSSVSVNVASALAFSKFKVCLIDGDFGLKNLDVMMGLENRVVYDLNGVVEGRCTIEQVLVKDKRIAGLSLLPSCKSLSFENLDTEIMNALIERLSKDFDFIIVDSPAGVEKGFEYSSSLASEAIVVVNLDVSSLRDADRVVGLLMKKGINTINMIVNKVNLDDIEANNRGVPIFLNEHHMLHNCFLNIANRLLGKQVPYLKYRKKSFIRRIFNT